jgi:glycosyltransferase 2 family protein
MLKGSKPKSGWWPTVFKGLVSMGLLALVLFFVDLGELIQVIAKANLWLLPIAFLVYWVDRALMAYKWSPLLRVLNVRVPYLGLLQIYSVAPLVGTLIPLPVSQEAFRVYALRYYGVSFRVALASIIAERMIGFIVMLVLASVSLSIALYLLDESWNHFSGVVLPLAVGIAVVLALTVTYVSFRASWIRSLGVKLSVSSIGAKVGQFFSPLREFQSRKGTVGAVVSWTFLEQVAPIIFADVLVQVLHIQASFIELMAIVPLVVLAVRVPISFEGFGIQEGLYVGLFALVGVSAAEALILSALIRVVGLLASLPWGIYYVLRFRSQRPLVFTNQAPL